MNRILRNFCFFGLLSVFLISPPAQAKIKEVLAEADGLYCEICTLAVLRQLRGPSWDEDFGYWKAGKSRAKNVS